MARKGLLFGPPPRKFLQIRAAHRLNAPSQPQYCRSMKCDTEPWQLPRGSQAVGQPSPKISQFVRASFLNKKGANPHGLERVLFPNQRPEMKRLGETPPIPCGKLNRPIDFQTLVFSCRVEAANSQNPHAFDLNRLFVFSAGSFFYLLSLALLYSAHFSEIFSSFRAEVRFHEWFF